MTRRLKLFIQTLVPLRFGAKKERLGVFSPLSGSGSGLSADFAAGVTCGFVRPKRQSSSGSGGKPKVQRCAGLTQRTEVGTRSSYRAGFLSGARFFRAPAAYRDGQAVFPLGNKQARGASSRCWVGAHLRKSVVKSTYRRQHMSARIPSRISLTAIVAAPLLVGVGSLATSGAALAACTGPGAPTTTETKCLTAVQIPGNPLRSYDISWVNPHRAEYYLADRSNAGIDIIDTQHLAFTRRLGGFVGVKLNANGTVNNDISGPDGVVTHGRWLYAGDGDSTLKVFDLDAPDASALKDTKSTRRGGDAGDPTRVDEMALTADGELLLTVNNAAEPPFANLFEANGDRSFS